MTLEGNPWFVAMDVLDTLGYPAASRTMILRKLDHTEIALKRIEGKSSRDLNLISESGLYKLTMRSDKPQAKAFQDWVTKEVLPSIRKTGSFVTGQPSLQENPKMDPPA